MRVKIIPRDDRKAMRTPPASQSIPDSADALLLLGGRRGLALTHRGPGEAPWWQVTHLMYKPGWVPRWGRVGLSSGTVSSSSVNQSRRSQSQSGSEGNTELSPGDLKATRKRSGCPQHRWNQEWRDRSHRGVPRSFSEPVEGDLTCAGSGKGVVPGREALTEALPASLPWRQRESWEETSSFLSKRNGSVTQVLLL